MIGAAKQWTMEKIGKTGMTVENEAFLALLKSAELTESTFLWISKLAKPLFSLPDAQEKAFTCEGDAFLSAQVNEAKNTIKKYKSARLHRNAKATAFGEETSKVGTKPEAILEAGEAFKKADQAYRESRDFCQAVLVQLERDRDKPFIDSVTDMSTILRNLRPAWNRPLVLSNGDVSLNALSLSPKISVERKTSASSPSSSSNSLTPRISTHRAISLSSDYHAATIILSQTLTYVEEGAASKSKAASVVVSSPFKNIIKANETASTTVFLVLTADQCGLFNDKKEYPSGLIKSLPLKNALIHHRADGFQIVDGNDCTHNFTLLPLDPFDESEAATVDAWVRQLCFVIPTKVFGVTLELAAQRCKQRVPLPLSLATEWLNKHALDEEGIYRVPGSKDEVERMIKQFDRNQDVIIPAQYFGGNVASLIVQFIRRLPESIYTEKLAPVFQQVANDTSVTEANCVVMLKKLVGMLPAVNKASLEVLVQHLKLVAENGEKNQMSASKLAMCIMSDNARSLQLLIEKFDQVFGA